jgi:hypothetical protein
MLDRSSKKPRPRDLNKLAKAIVDAATGDPEPAEDDPRDPAAVELGRRGGLRGGPPN